MIISDRTSQIIKTIKNKNINETEQLNIVSSLQNPSNKQLSDDEFKSLWILYHNISNSEKIILLKKFHDDYVQAQNRIENSETVSKIIYDLKNFSPLNFLVKNKLKKIKDKKITIDNDLNERFFITTDNNSLSLLNLSVIAGNKQSFVFLFDNDTYENSKFVIQSAFYYALLASNKEVIEHIYLKHKNILHQESNVNFTEAYLFSDEHNIEPYDKNKYGCNPLIISKMDSKFFSFIAKRSFTSNLKKIANIIDFQSEGFLAKIEKNYILKLVEQIQPLSDLSKEKINFEIKSFYKNINKPIPEIISSKMKAAIYTICDKDKLKQKITLNTNNAIKNSLRPL